MTRLSFAATIAVAMLFPAATFAADAGASGVKSNGARISCKTLKQIEVAQSSVNQQTESSVFVDIKAALVSFTIRGSANTCVLVNFSATTEVLDNGPGMIVRAIRDSGVESVDGPIMFAKSDGTNVPDTHAYNFLFTDVPPGDHAVQMQYRSLSPVYIVFISDFDMVVHHK